MKTKRLTLEVKDADQGLVVAKFAQLDVIDHDGDVTLTGAFRDGAPVAVSPYGHSAMWGDAPVGKGHIREDDGWAIADLAFNLKSAGGRDAFATVQFMGDQQEWSYGFDILESDSGTHDGQRVRFLKALDVFEISPVLRGAGIGTHTVSAKDGDHATYAEDGERALAACRTFTHRSGALAALRAKEGRALSTVNRDRLKAVADGMQETLDDIAALLTEQRDDEKSADVARAEHMRFMAGRVPTPIT